MGFSRQEYWSGLPCPPPGDLDQAKQKHEAAARLQRRNWTSRRGPGNGSSGGCISTTTTARPTSPSSTCLTLRAHAAGPPSSLLAGTCHPRLSAAAFALRLGEKSDISLPTRAARPREERDLPKVTRSLAGGSRREQELCRSVPSRRPRGSAISDNCVRGLPVEPGENLLHQSGPPATRVPKTTAAVLTPQVWSGAGME